MGRTLALVFLTASAALALAQGTTVPPPSAAGLEDVLKGWETSMGRVTAMVADLSRTRLDKTFGSTEVFEGKAKFVRSTLPGQPSRASLDLKMKSRPEIFERYIFTGAFLYEYRPSSKVIAVHKLPPAKGGEVADDNIVSFIFGMKADDVKKRYLLELTAGDKYYHYLKVVPRFPADKAEFSEARLTLIRESSLPRQFWFRQPNGDEITWDFNKINPAAAVPVTEFGKPDLPAGWKWEVQTDLAPRVMRK